ncbi:MSMEG_0570 family nitrogen starvation response protein [Aeromicrobium endophyticum]|uniref:MSMEG_0570 family nitrogen starvation response protein n=1 Tax=Aeromicrobium endophyticum TaxID=2292704 RepID=A0A371P1B7_9ACTN|nr:MSMEG_0570 family nitrogen starvation response protein [Aeromicrobium endophyticum]REK69705.1 MSMEG_0570 family nitrogen starvation response protein [Aeromicrobium endophyticum]
MPEMTVTVRWPDGRVTDCYSPSLVMHDHLAAGTTYRVDEFVRRASVALGEASERVRARYGFTCSASAASLERIERSAAAFDRHDSVDVLAMQPSLPAPQEAP